MRYFQTNSGNIKHLIILSYIQILIIDWCEIMLWYTMEMDQIERLWNHQRWEILNLLLWATTIPIRTGKLRKYNPKAIESALKKEGNIPVVTKRPTSQEQPHVSANLIFNVRSDNKDINSSSADTWYSVLYFCGKLIIYLLDVISTLWFNLIFHIF